jgi:hypothetical protein
MTLPPDQRPPEQRPALATDDAMAVVSAYGAFRLLLGLLAAWSFFAGFALLIGALPLGDDQLGERVVGAHMIVLSPVYGLLAWRRSAYRLFIWVPYAAQAAIVLPGLWEFVVNQNGDGGVLLIVSIIFLVLLIYLWTSSHPLGFFQPADVEDDEDDDEVDPDDDATAGAPQSLNDASARARRYRRTE